jgi:hypothetical protein
MQSTEHHRETLIERYENAESKWNTTYSKEIGFLKVSVIKDTKLYEQAKQDI